MSKIDSNDKTMQGVRLLHEHESETKRSHLPNREMVKITKPIKFDLPEPLSEPGVIDDFFTAEMFQRVKNHIESTGLNSGNLKFHTMYARWEVSQLQFDQDIEDHCLKMAKQIFKDNTLKKAYFFATRYQYKDGCIPHLWEHVDQNGTQTTIDITIENTADWSINVENKNYPQKPNSAVFFCGQQHMHSRPPYPTRDENKYITVLFLHFTQPNHWIQKGQKQISIYGDDGNVRFFNNNRFLPMPDPPFSQPVCECHDYSRMLNLYDDICGAYVDSESEIPDMSILSKDELAPGIIKYTISHESARILRGLAQNSMFKQWQVAEVLANGKSPEINTSVRNCFNYTLTNEQNKCHPQDPIRRLNTALTVGIDSIIEDYRKRFNIVSLFSSSTVLLRYEENNKFSHHIDDHPKYPRVVSASLILNDDYDGGDFEFREFGLRVKPKTGDVLVFCSSFPYSHEIHKISNGIRYSVVKWYRFANEENND